MRTQQFKQKATECLYEAEEEMSLVGTHMASPIYTIKVLQGIARQLKGQLKATCTQVW